MPTTMKLIAKTTAGSGGAASFDFQSIPATFTDLFVTISARSPQALIQDRIVIRFNDSSANYDFRALYADGSSAASATRAGWGDNNIGWVPGSTATANTFGSLEMYIPNYAGSANKSVAITAVHETNGTTAYIFAAAGLWSQTAGINRLTFSLISANNFSQHSTAQLFGIVKA